MYRQGSKEARVSNSRYFNVMGEGWYVLTREGVSGPYPEKHQAIDFVQTVVIERKSFDFPHSGFEILTFT